MWWKWWGVGESGLWVKASLPQIMTEASDEWVYASFFFFLLSSCYCITSFETVPFYTQNGTRLLHRGIHLIVKRHRVSALLGHKFYLIYCLYCPFRPRLESISRSRSFLPVFSCSLILYICSRIVKWNNANKSLFLLRTSWDLPVVCRMLLLFRFSLLFVPLSILSLSFSVFLSTISSYVSPIRLSLSLSPSIPSNPLRVCCMYERSFIQWIDVGVCNIWPNHLRDVFLRLAKIY